jgi:hypothetical protein
VNRNVQQKFRKIAVSKQKNKNSKKNREAKKSAKGLSKGKPKYVLSSLATYKQSIHTNMHQQENYPK